MRISIDKRGNINLPMAVRKQLALEPGSTLNLTVDDYGTITLRPVVIYREIRLNERGAAKLKEARTVGTGKLPDWLCREMDPAEADPLG